MMDLEDPKAVVTDNEPARTPITGVDNAFRSAANKPRPLKRAWNINGEIGISEGPDYED